MVVRWPWLRPRAVRESGGDVIDAVVRLVEAAAAGTATDASGPAAVEAAAGALSRAFDGAEVSGPDWAIDVLSPTFLAQAGRDLARSGDSMYVIRLRGGRVRPMAASSWHFEGTRGPDTWSIRVTT